MSLDQSLEAKLLASGLVKENFAEVTQSSWTSSTPTAATSGTAASHFQRSFSLFGLNFKTRHLNPQALGHIDFYPGGGSHQVSKINLNKIYF